jgi:hypothetical protein
MLRAIQSLALTAVAGIAFTSPTVAEVPSLSPTQTFSQEFEPSGITVADFGCAVAVDGDSAAAPHYERGVVSIYRRPSRGAAWTEVQQIPLDATECTAVDLQGNTLIFEEAGVLRVYVDDGTTWKFRKTLKAEDGARLKGVFLDGHTVIATGNSGAAYVFVRSAGAWTQQARLSPANGAVVAAIAFQGNTLLLRTVVVGAPDGGTRLPTQPVYVFARIFGTWSEQHTLLPTGEVLAPFLSNTGFGASGAVYDNVAVIGAVNDGEFITPFLENPVGAAYVFVRRSGVWTQQQKLVSAFDMATNSFVDFGRSVAIEPNRIVIGAPHANSQIEAVMGGLFGFVRHGDVWKEELRVPGFLRGTSLSLANGTLLHGSDGDPEFATGFIEFFELNTPPVVTGLAVKRRNSPYRVLIQATVDDRDTGGSNIHTAFYTVNGGRGQPIRPADGVFDEPSEWVSAAVTLEPGVHKICIVGIDGLRNPSRPACMRHKVKKNEHRRER